MAATSGHSDIASEENSTYKDAIAKGQKLLDMMRASDSVTGMMLKSPAPLACSQFLNQSSLNDWGYTRTLSDFKEADGWFKDISTALSKSQFLSQGAMVLSDIHNMSTTHGATTFPSTQAEFVSIIDRAKGLLIAARNHSPSSQVAETKLDGSPLPELQHWSDMAYLQWTDPRLQTLPGDLKDVIRSRIENETTIAVIERIIAGRGYREGFKTPGCYYPDAAGLSWGMETEEAKALLGTPNGSGVARLLVQHKRQFGWKVVESVTLFWDAVDRGYPSTHPSLLFRLKDVNEEIESSG